MNTNFKQSSAYELADDLESYDWYYEHEVTGSDGYTQEIKTCNTEYVWDAANMLRQQADRITELDKGGEVAGRFYWESVVDGHVMAVPSEGTPHYNKDDFPLYTTPQIKELSDEELNKAFDYYCETDEGVLRFNYELRDEWKKEQLIRWKEAFKKASER